MASRTKSRGAAGRSKATPKKTERISFWARIVRTLRAGRERIQERLARQSDDVWGVGLIVLAALVALSFFGLSGPIGAGGIALVSVGVFLTQAPARKGG